MKFEWDYSISHGIRHDKDVMLAPVAFNSYDKHMYMQFDLGADVTMLYEKSIQAISNRESISATCWINRSIRRTFRTRGSRTANLSRLNSCWIISIYSLMLTCI